MRLNKENIPYEKRYGINQRQWRAQDSAMLGGALYMIIISTLVPQNLIHIVDIFSIQAYSQLINQLFFSVFETVLSFVLIRAVTIHSIAN